MSGIQSIHRAMDALEAISRAPGIGVSALSREMGVPVSTAHGIVATLIARRYVLHGASGYDVGPAVAALAGSWRPARALSAVLEQAMADLSAATGMASTATVLDGRAARILAYVPAPGPITVRGGPEFRDPLTLATGRLLIALGNEGEWARFLESNAGVEPGWTTGRWRRELTTIRDAGLAMKTTRDPRLEVSIAVPVRGPGDAVICAIGCSTPSFLAEDIFNEPTLEQIVEAGDRLTEVMGGIAVPHPVVSFPDHTSSARFGARR